MRVDSFSKYSLRGPSSRYRLYQFVEQFRDAGIDFRIHPLFEDRYFEILRTRSFARRTLLKMGYVPGRFWKRRAELEEAAGSLVHIEQQLFPYLPFFFEKRYLPANYIVEFDDAIFLTHPSKFPYVLRHAAGVIAGNQFLADFATRYNSNVRVVPTVLDTSRFRPIKNRKNNLQITLGWSGLEYNFKYLKLIDPVLARLTKEYPVEVAILSGSPPSGLSFPFRFEKWDPEKEVEQIDQFDIGLMPLASDDWCKGKCGFKLLQYMSLEIPSVASAVGVNTEIIKPAVNGYTANTPEEWLLQLETLIQDNSLRINLGKAARETVIRDYSTNVWFPRILDIYRSFTGRKEPVSSSP